MSDMQMQFELKLRDNLSSKAQKALRNVSEENRRIVKSLKDSTTPARSMADTLGRVAREGRTASRSVDSLARAVRSVGNVPFAQGVSGLRQMEQQARRAEASFRKAGQSLRANLGGAAKDGLANASGQIMALGGGVAAAGSLMHLVGMDKRNAAFKANTNMANEEMDAFKQKRRSAAAKTHVSESDIMGISEKVQEITGNKEFIAENMEVLAKAQKASQSSAESMGSMGAVLHDMGITKSSELEQTLSGLIEQGDKASYTFKNFTDYGGGVASQYSALGRNKKDGAFEINTALQLANSSLKNPAMATTAVDAFLRDLQKEEIQDKLKKRGIGVYDKNGKFRNIVDIQKDILTKTGGDMRKFNKLGFSDEGKRAMTFAIGEYQKTKNFEFIDKLNVTGQEGTLDRKWKENIQSIDSGLIALGNAWEHLIDAIATDPLRKASQYITSMDEESRTIGVGITAAVALLGAAFAKAKLASAAWAGLQGMLNKGAAHAGTSTATSTAATTLGKVQSVKKILAAGNQLPVRATYAADGKRLIDLSRQPATSASASPVPQIPANPGGMWAGAKNIAKGSWLTGLFSAYDAYQTETDDNLSRDQKNAAHTGTAGGLAGALAGGAAGAAALSIVPVVGTAIGGLLGSIAGYFGGSELGGWLGQKMFGTEEDAPVEASASPPLTAQQQPIIIEQRNVFEVDGATLAEVTNRYNAREGVRH